MYLTQEGGGGFLQAWHPYLCARKAHVRSICLDSIYPRQFPYQLNDRTHQ